MIKICIDVPRSSMNLRAIAMLRRDDWVLKDITICFNPERGLREGQYPLIVRFDSQLDNVEVYVHNLAVGYGGEGPRNTAAILDFFDIEYDPEDIFSKRKAEGDGTINLCFRR